MTEQEARTAIEAWAKHRFREELDPEPDVDIINLTPSSGDSWEAELEVSTSADNPFVTFYMAPEPYGLQIVSIDY